MRTKVILTPYNNIITGKYSKEAEHIYVLLDTTLAPFTVMLPDCTNGNQFELIFKNIGTNTARIQAVNSQYIDNKTYHDLASWDLVSVWSDLINRWIMLDNNSIPPIILPSY